MRLLSGSCVVVLDHPYLSAIYSAALIFMELKISCYCDKLGGLGLYCLSHANCV